MTRHRNPFAVAAELNLAALHTGVTLWHRWPMIMGMGGSRHTAELNRMVSEKVAAMGKGIINAQAEATRAALYATMGKSSNPFCISLAIADAAMQPALRTVKGNSRRLSRRRK